jgi:hypothetical protein
MVPALKGKGKRAAVTVEGKSSGFLNGAAECITRKIEIFIDLNNFYRLEKKLMKIK